MLEFVRLSNDETTYPVARKHREHGFIVLFFSEKHGVVVDRFLTILVKPGEISSTWTSCHDSECWEPVEITITG